MICRRQIRRERTGLPRHDLHDEQDDLAAVHGRDGQEIHQEQHDAQEGEEAEELHEAGPDADLRSRSSAALPM